VRIDTPRLALHSLPPALVAALVDKDLERAGDLAPFRLDATTFEGDDYVLGLRHAQLTADPREEPWLLRAAVFREVGVVVGKVGFHAPPDAEGTVEIGYRVDPAYRRQGFAKEMAGALLWWAAEQGAKSCLASVRPDNEPSLAIIRRLGFVRTGEQIDEIDGLEWVFTLALDTLPSYDDGR
jgi:ribosomal-protein-alanine N-acetyltransferase